MSLTRMAVRRRRSSTRRRCEPSLLPSSPPPRPTRSETGAVRARWATQWRPITSSRCLHHVIQIQSQWTTRASRQAPVLASARASAHALCALRALRALHGEVSNAALIYLRPACAFAEVRRRTPASASLLRSSLRTVLSSIGRGLAVIVPDDRSAHILLCASTSSYTLRPDVIQTHNAVDNEGGSTGSGARIGSRARSCTVRTARTAAAA
mmetsp:Transcript_3997/g.14872  ORF Transcript_3997/g.14872 Transcript_3997/m.14872 type:complete len:210 (-) Transcript_3997:8-637(-)